MSISELPSRNNLDVFSTTLPTYLIELFLPFCDIPDCYAVSLTCRTFYHLLGQINPFYALHFMLKRHRKSRKLNFPGPDFFKNESVIALLLAKQPYDFFQVTNATFTAHEAEGFKEFMRYVKFHMCSIRTSNVFLMEMAEQAKEQFRKLAAGEKPDYDKCNFAMNESVTIYSLCHAAVLKQVESSDLEMVLLALRHDASLYEAIPEHQKLDRRAILTALSRGLKLESVPWDRVDISLMKYYSGRSYQLSEPIRKLVRGTTTPSVAYTLLHHFPYLIHDELSNWKDDPRATVLVSRQQPEFLANSSLRNNFMHVRQIIAANFRACCYCPTEMLKVPDLVLTILQNASRCSLEQLEETRRCISCIPEEMFAHPRIAPIYGFYSILPESIRAQKHILVKALSNVVGNQWQFFPNEELKKDKEFVLEMIAYAVLPNLDPSLLADPDFVEKALLKNLDFIRVVDLSKVTKETILKILATGKPFPTDGFTFPGWLLQDRQLMKQIILSNSGKPQTTLLVKNDFELSLFALAHGGRFDLISDALKKDPKFIEEAIKVANIGIIQYVPPEMITKEIAMYLVERHIDNFLRLPKEWIMDPDIIKLAYSQKSKSRYGAGWIYQLPQDMLKNSQFVLQVIKAANSTDILQYTDAEVVKDKSVALTAVAVNPHCLALSIMHIYQDDREIIAEAIKKDPEALQYASINLRNDAEMRKLQTDLHKLYLPLDEEFMQDLSEMTAEEWAKLLGG